MNWSQKSRHSQRLSKSRGLLSATSGSSPTPATATNTRTKQGLSEEAQVGQKSFRRWSCLDYCQNIESISESARLEHRCPSLLKKSEGSCTKSSDQTLELLVQKHFLMSHNLAWRACSPNHVRFTNW